MPDLRWNYTVERELLQRASLEAIQIVGDRVVEDAKPMTRVLSTKPPGRREAYYSLPPGTLRESIHDQILVDELGQANYIYAQVPLGRFRNIGGRGRPAYGNRGNNPALEIATELQRGRPVP